MIKYLVVISLLIASFTTYSYGDIYVVVSKDNNIQTISKKELEMLYLKKTTLLNGTRVYVVNNKEFYNDFNKNVLNKTPNQIHSYWMKQIFLGKNVPPPLLSSKDIKKLIDNKSNQIGYDKTSEDYKTVYKIAK